MYTCNAQSTSRKSFALILVSECFIASRTCNLGGGGERKEKETSRTKRICMNKTAVFCLGNLVFVSAINEG
jgi:hypothetical protein